MTIISCIRHAMIHKLHQSITYCYNILQHVSWDKSCFHEITFVIIIVPTLPPYPPFFPDPKQRISWLMSQQPQMQIQLQTYIIVATTNDNLYAKYELYRRSRSFTISLFVLHCTPLYHIDPDHEVNPHHLSCERTRPPFCLKTCIHTIQHIVIIIPLHPRQMDL